MSIKTDEATGLKIFDTRAVKATEKIAGKGYSEISDEALKTLPAPPPGAVFNAEEQARYRAFKEVRRGAADYIAMEGAALGITFSASTGDTGAESCGLYAMNGAPQTEVNISIPSGGYYFTALGGTDFLPITTCTGVQSACYTHEDAWTFGAAARP